MQLSTRPIATFLAIVLALTGLSLPNASAAVSISSYTSQIQSSTGGGGLTDASCGTGKALRAVGSYVNNFDGPVMSNTYGYCVLLQSNGLSLSSSTSDEHYIGPYGSSGTTPWSADNCSALGGSRVVVGARLYKSPSGYSAGVKLRCGDLPTGGNASFNSGIIGSSTSTYEDISCDVGSVAVGLYIKQGSILDRFGLNCARIQSAYQSITLAGLGTTSKSYPYSQNLSMTTSGGSGSGAVTYSIVAGGTASSCSLSNSSSAATITASTAGTCLIQATKASDTNYASAVSSTLIFTFNRATQVLSFPVTSYSKSFNETFTVATNGSSGTGQIAFSAGSSTACTVGSATGIVTITASTGSCTITATIAQDLNYESASSSNSISVAVSTAASTTSVSLAAGNLVYRQNKTITATASAAGTLSFRANNSRISGCQGLIVNVSNSYTRTCTYKPTTRGYVTIQVLFTPTNSSYRSSSAQSEKLFITNRSTPRS